VYVTAFDPNGNTEDLGTVTTSIDGSYAIDWTPLVPGLYAITASFAGANSHYSSSAATHLAVGKTVVSPLVTSAPTAVPTFGPTSSVSTPTPVSPSSPSPSQAA